jgi:hypothetical protein
MSNHVKSCRIPTPGLHDDPRPGLTVSTKKGMMSGLAHHSSSRRAGSTRGASCQRSCSTCTALHSGRHERSRPSYTLRTTPFRTPPYTLAQRHCQEMSRDVNPSQSRSAMFCHTIHRDRPSIHVKPCQSGLSRSVPATPPSSSARETYPLHTRNPAPGTRHPTPDARVSGGLWAPNAAMVRSR